MFARPSELSPGHTIRKQFRTFQWRYGDDDDMAANLEVAPSLSLGETGVREVSAGRLSSYRSRRQSVRSSS